MRQLILSAAFITLLLAQRTAFADQAPRPPTSVEAGVYLKGENSGKYREETQYETDGITDTVEQLYVFNRVGSRVELSSKETYHQDPEGRIKSGHFETTASKSTVVTDIVVKDQTVEITTHSGSGNYVRKVPLTGELLGPEGQRRLLLPSTPPQTLHYKSFVSSLGAITDVTVKYIGRENLSAGGKSVTTLKAELTMQGTPGTGRLWVDQSGHLVRMLQDSPLGEIEVARDHYQSAESATTNNPTESYESTLAISNVQLPHPRKIQAVTVELTKKAGAEAGWPEFSSDTQKILEKTPDRIVISITRGSTDPGVSGSSRSEPACEQPNALIQSDDPEVQRLAQGITAGTTDPWQKALALQRWVANNMHFDAGITMAPASELVRDRHGTCIGYSTLLAALARAANIPSRMKLGYVYDSGIWGGHAWTEVLVHRHWMPLDAAEYYPGPTDAARIAVITTSGESGTIDRIGDLALLYGKVNIRTLGYALAGKPVRVGEMEKGYVVDHDVYSNLHLNLRVTKTKDSVFKDLDAHWPERRVLTIVGPDGSAEILYGRANPDLSLQEQAAEFLADFRAQNWEKTTWEKTPAIRVAGGEKQAIVGRSGDVLWAVVSTGKNAARVLEEIIRNAKINDLAGGPGEG